jgi:hypothetical protein
LERSFFVACEKREMPMGAKVIVRRDDAILRVALNRPGKRNALDREMYESLIDALAQADADQALRVVLIESAGDAFTAGNDLNDFRQAIGEVEDFPAFRFVRALARCETPIVAAVKGDAVGVGTTMLLHCDLVYAATNARFKMPFVDLGLPRNIFCCAKASTRKRRSIWASSTPWPPSPISNVCRSTPRGGWLKNRATRSPSRAAFCAATGRKYSRASTKKAPRLPKLSPRPRRAHGWKRSSPRGEATTAEG